MKLTGDRKQGECCRCGLCCLGVVIRAEGMPPRDFITYSGLHGIEFDPEGGWLFIPARCRNLSPEGLCVAWEARPEICRNYPQPGDWRPACCTLSP